MKFGGTSVGSPEAIRHVVDIMKRTSEQQHQAVVVVSAMNAPSLRTTDTLIHSARLAAQGNYEEAVAALPKLHDLYMEAARDLSTPAECDTLHTKLQEIFDLVDKLLYSISILNELTPRALDLISGQGERCNARLIASAARSAGLDSRAIDATDLIITDEQHGEANPLMRETCAQCEQHIVPLLELGSIPIVTGFIGTTTEGVPTTLGRGGSDYSCAILGAALGADEAWFWKEVDGVMTADPRIVPDARSLPSLSYTEMAELAYYGANILHPRTVYPLVQRSIPTRILNTFNPSHPGTTITQEAVNTIKAVTSIDNVSMIRVGGPGMLGLRGIAARIFGAVARVGSNILLITQASSEQNICFIVPQHESEATVKELRHELARDLSHHDVEHVDVIEPVSIVALVGSGMRGLPGIAGRAFSALGEQGINIIAIAQGSTEYNISLVVNGADGANAIQVIHRAFDLGAS
jgi:aspartate kinase